MKAGEEDGIAPGELVLRLATGEVADGGIARPPDFPGMRGRRSSIRAGVAQEGLADGSAPAYPPWYVF